MNSEFRRARRRKVPESIAVVDTMTEHTVGRLSNLSESGMLLIASVPLVEDALYQFRFNLSRAGDPGKQVEVGAHLLWQDSTNAPGQSWSGFRFIGLLESQMQQLRAWLDAPGGRFE